MAINTYYVDGAVGDDSNLGTSEGAGNAWATFNKGLQSLLANDDHLYVKASVVYYEVATMSTFSNTVGHPQIIEGYTTTPGDGGVVNIDGSSTRTYCITAIRNEYIFRNIKATNATLYGFNLNGSDVNRFENCEASDNGNRGFYVDNYCTFINCQAHNNTYYGIWADQYAVLIDCVATNNGNYAASLRGYSAVVINSVFAGGALAVLELTQQAVIINCVIDGRNSSNYGIKFGSSTYIPTMVMNSIVYDCDVGIYTSAILRPPAIAYNNILYSNTTNYSPYWDVEHLTGTDILSDPLFTDSTNYDYTLGTGSPAIAAGKTDLGEEERTDIGAYQTALPSGGGTSRVILTS